MFYSPSVAFLADSVGGGEWIVLFVVILIVVGPKNMPDVVRKIGRMMEMFRRAADEFKDQLMTMDQETHAPSVPPPEVSSHTDADGLPAATDANVSSPEAYGDAYPDEADYPGNEHAGEVGSSGASPVDGAASAASDVSAAETVGGVSSAEKPDGTSVPQKSDSAKGTPAGGGA